jgi:serine/threonine protein phosphatase PrpC
MSLLSSGLTNIGKKRKINQDSIYLNPEKSLFIVADGMGGHKGGEVASSLAVQHIPEHMLANLDEDPVETSKKAIQNANTKIKDESDRNEETRGMGTTVVQLFFKGSKLFVGNLGDSRAYLVNKGKLYQLSKDHSLVQEKVNVGLYTRDQAIKDPNKNVLSRTCGFKDEIEVDVFTYKVKKNDLFFICSDGLSGFVSDHDVVTIINKFLPDPGKSTQEELDKTLSTLIDQANFNGGADNISVIAVIAQ